MTKADLHIHSHYSNDGELSIAELVKKSKEKDLKILSITDHNNVGGVSEALELCKISGISFIPGIEIDCNYKGTDMHLLAYHVDWLSQEIRELEARTERVIMEAVPVMIRNLASAGIEIDGQELMEKSKGKLPAPELFAEVLMSNPDYHHNPLLKPYLPGGERSDMPYINFYLDYFAQGKAAYVKLELMDFSVALELVKRNGGIPVVAHPGLNFKGKEEQMEELLDLGAEGMEVFNNYHSKNQMEYFASLSQSRGSLISAGSDFHGKTKPLIELGAYPMLETYREALSHSIQYLLDYETGA
jgi:predicted metal-dependent phosphoesterase TrpH